jgi:hypothetical protein
LDARHLPQAGRQINRSVDIHVHKSRCNEETIQLVSAQAKSHWDEAGDSEWLQDALQSAGLGTAADENLRYVTGFHLTAHHAKIYPTCGIFLPIQAVILAIWGQYFREHGDRR